MSFLLSRYTLFKQITASTINADAHAWICNFHKLGDEKRMDVTLPTGLYDDWLTAPPAQSHKFLLQYPAQKLIVVPAAG